MRTKTFSLICSFLWMGFCSSAIAALGDISIDADSVQYSPTTTLTTAKGAVKIVNNGYILQCDEATLNRETLDYTAHGHIHVTIADQGTWTAESAKGNIRDKSVSFGPYRLHGKVWHSVGQSGGTGEDGDRQVRKAWLSTCEYDTPHYTINASTMTFNPDKKTFSSWNNLIKFGSVPVFYIPYFWTKTNDDTGLFYQPGYSGDMGAYLRVGMKFRLGDFGKGRVYTDLTTIRGIGVGLDTKCKTEDRTIQTQLYEINDKEIDETEKGRVRRWESREDRHRLHLYWREKLDDNWTVRLNADYLSDIAMLEDWYSSEHSNLEQPKSFFDVEYNNTWMNLTMSVRPRINDFYTVSERLPELKLTLPEQRLFDSLPFLYSSESSAGYYSMKYRDTDYSRQYFLKNTTKYPPEIYCDPADYSAFRMDTLHTLKANFDLGDIITLTPRASVRVTHYSKSSKNGVTREQLADNFDADNDNWTSNTSPVTQYDDEGGSQTRYATEYGIEGRSKFYSDWKEINFEPLKIDSLRHVIEPYFNYTFAPEPNVSCDNLYFFDEIDRLEKMNFLRVGLDQRWQHRSAKDGEMSTLFSWQTYVDIHHSRDDETDSHWGDFGNRIDLNLPQGTTLYGLFLYNIGDGVIHRGEVGTSVQTIHDIVISGKYIYRHQHMSRSAYSMGSTLADFTNESGYIKKYYRGIEEISGTLSIPLNEKTSLDCNVSYDLIKSELSSHSYSLTRELHCWTMVLTASWSSYLPTYTILFRLTALPEFKLHLNI